MKDAIRPVRNLFGHTSASEFGPLALKSVRQHMIDVQDLSRGVINDRVNRIKRVFKWAVSEELIPPRIDEGLRTVAGLRYGRTTARETEPGKPAPDYAVESALPFVAPQVAAITFEAFTIPFFEIRIRMNYDRDTWRIRRDRFRETLFHECQVRRVSTFELLHRGRMVCPIIVTAAHNVRDDE